MRVIASPSLVLSLAALVAAAVTFGTVYAALFQPWMGLSLAPRGDGVVIIAAQGPAAGLPVEATVETLAGAGQDIRLEPLDLAPEPDGAMGDYRTYHRFLERQDILSRIQRAGIVEVRLSKGETFSVAPQPRRPIGSLPVAFWVQLAVGIFAWLIAASIFAYRRTESAVHFLLLSGAATLIFAPFAGVYSTRELALPATLFQWLNDLNFLGGSLFTASFVAVLLNYPRRIGPGWIGYVVVAVFVIWFIAQQLGFFESMTFARRFLVMIGALTTFGLAGWHWFASRREPATRAALQWFLLSWVVGSGLFALFILLPQMFGVDTSGLQGYAFLLFLLVYCGLAFGILRYRLFDLDRWWTGAFLCLLAALLLIGLDFLFLFVLHLSSEMSLALALFICGVLWLPLRGMIWGRLFGSRDTATETARFRQVTDVALAPPDADRQARWRTLVSDVFRPLGVETYRGEAIMLDEHGLALLIPGADGLSGLRLTYADGGRRLFGPRDVGKARQILDMLTAAAESRKFYEKGVVTERTRIARDMHDNIGAQLLSALHSEKPERKDTMIRETIADLRDIINNVSQGGKSLGEVLTDLKHETRERLAVADIGLDWHEDIGDDHEMSLGPNAIHSLRSILREAVSNTVRHSGARWMTIRIVLQEGMLQLNLSDDGTAGKSKADIKNIGVGGNGLNNIEMRIAAVDGKFSYESSARGFVIHAELPLSQHPKQ